VGKHEENSSVERLCVDGTMMMMMMIIIIIGKIKFLPITDHEGPEGE
jgi:hypothetical protein